MKKEECQRVIEGYVNWLGKELTTQQLDGACELTVPFLDRHNDYLQIYAVETNKGVRLTDEGYILSDLRASGMEFNTPKREEALDSILNGFGVKRQGDELCVVASKNNLGQSVHCLVQVMLSVNDMFVLSQPKTSSFFWEDVRGFFEQNGIRYSPRVKISGKTGYDHAIDFVIPASKNKSERIVQTINSANRNTISSYLFTLQDIREARGRDSAPYAFLNDTNGKISADVLDALSSYNVTPAMWSERMDYIDELAA